MSNALLAALLQMSLLAPGADTYKDAYKASQEEGKPLVVLVGADWCPGCRTMKDSVMPSVKSHGKLDEVAFATLNTDQERTLSSQMMSGNLIPQLVMYTKVGDGWKIKRLVGAQSASAVEDFLAQGVAEMAAARKAAGNSVAAVSRETGDKSKVEKN